MTIMNIRQVSDASLNELLTRLTNDQGETVVQFPHLAKIALIQLINERNEIKSIVDKEHDPKFDFDQEYWDSGNYDDAYKYGVDTGNQYAYQKIAIILVKDEAEE